jgi:amidohydrolase
MTTPIDELDSDLIGELTEFRRDLHSHPELGFQETRTAARVAAALRASGVDVTEGVGGTGLVGTIRGVGSGDANIGLRADMDALSLVEETGLPYASRTPGIMHGCGHDGHTAVLLGAARRLAADRDFGGSVHVIFQPAEEGLGGASAMLDDGLFERFPCDAVYALHTAPGLPVSVIATGTGAVMAGGGTFAVTFTGAGGHGGQGAHLASDLTVAQATYVMALQTIVSRNVPALETAVVSVGYVNGGRPDAPNVMPAELSLGGTMRCFSKEAQDLVAGRIHELAETIAAAYGCSATARVTWVTTPLVNTPDQVEIVARAARSVLGTENVFTDMAPITGGEDFALMLEARPGGFVFPGNGTAPDGAVHNERRPRLHNGSAHCEAEPTAPGTTLTMTSVEVRGASGGTSSTRIVCVPGGSGRIVVAHAVATKVVVCASTPRMFGDGRLAVICGDTARYRSA